MAKRERESRAARPSQKAASQKPTGQKATIPARHTAEKPSEASESSEVASESDELSERDESDELSEEASDEGSESEESSEDEDEIPKKKKAKGDDGSSAFASAFNNIIGSKLKAHDREAPIMVRNKTVVKKLESDKLEHKAKRALLAEKKSLQDKHRIKNLLPTEEHSVREVLENEKKLKKIAQKGVVRLFNAILSTQTRTLQELSGEKVGEVKKQELFNEMSKEKFLDLVQTAGTE